MAVNSSYVTVLLLLFINYYDTTFI